jgi:hypothetical protein
VSGTVTVEPGRILGDSAIAIQDATGGICVSLPSNVPTDTIVRGAVVQLTGVLAAPYANLEVRPGSAAEVAVTGVALDPTPLDLTAATLGEPAEGMLARVTGTLEHKDPSSSGSLALTLGSSTGDVRVFLHAALGAGSDDFEVGATYVALGIVGQRESAKGLNDGYRLWPRAVQDVTLLSPAPTDTPAATPTTRTSPSPRDSPTARPTATPRATATPRPTSKPRPTATASPKPTGTPGPSHAPLVSIAEALRRPGETVRVQGTVTSRAGFLDADARRVTIESRGAAILLRLPQDAAVPGLGTRIEATGEVGTYYGAPQLAADDPPDRKHGGAAAPTLLRRAPDASDEWRLVRVTVRIENVSKSGDTWRAEASLGAGGSLPIAGLASSGIPSTALVEGRSGTITGIVKRAYPTASDQRFAIAPRSTADIQLGAEPRPSSSPTDGRNPGGSEATPPWDGDPSDAPWLASGDPSAGSSNDPQHPTGSLGAGSNAEPVDTTVDGLPALVGSRVRVAGRVQSPSTDGFSLVDATGEIGVRMLTPGSLDPLLLVPDEIVNVVGWDSQRDVGDVELVVVAPQDVVRGPRLSAGAALTAADPSDAPSTVPAALQPDPIDGGGPSVIGFVALVALVGAMAATAGFGVLAYRSWRRRRA